MELRSLAYFLRIAELGSITRAAAHLRLAQPALTRHVQRLEEELGVPLFTRANRGVRLTEAGQKLLESAARILREVERTGDEIRAQDAHPSGRIILGITPTLCPVLVPEFLPAPYRKSVLSVSAGSLAGSGRHPGRKAGASSMAARVKSWLGMF